MADVLGKRWPVGICFYAGSGPDVARLGKAMITGVHDELEAQSALIDFKLGEPILRDADELARRIGDGPTILHIVSHADEQGRVHAEDAWGDLQIEPDALASLVKGHGVRLAVVLTCFGAEVARALVDADAVDVAIGITTPLGFGAALGFSKGFYGGLGRGWSIQQAFDHGLAHAGLRSADVQDELVLSAAAGKEGCLNLAICRPADFFIMGADDEHDGIAALIAGLEEPTEDGASFNGFHVDYSVFEHGGLPMELGSRLDQLILARLEGSKVIMVLVKNEPADRNVLPDLIARAVEEASYEGIRLFPVYIRGDRRTRRLKYLPLGLARLTPAFLSRFGSETEHWKELGEWLRALVK